MARPTGRQFPWSRPARVRRPRIATEIDQAPHGDSAANPKDDHRRHWRVEDVIETKRQDDEQHRPPSPALAMKRGGQRIANNDAQRDQENRQFAAKTHGVQDWYEQSRKDNDKASQRHANHGEPVRQDRPPAQSGKNLVLPRHGLRLPPPQAALTTAPRRRRKGGGAPTGLAVHGFKEVIVVFRVLQLVQQELHGINHAHRHQHPAQHPHL